MLDGVTLDQVRTFISAVDEGSFSAAGRKLRRAQSVVSQTLANLEAQLGLKLFDRSARYPKLTEQGRSLLAEARAIADTIDGFKARARSMRQGLEPELAVAIDVLFPMDKITRAASHSRLKYPHTSLRLYVEALGGVIQPLLERRCTIGVIGSMPEVPAELYAEPLRDIPMVTVVSPAHPLASLRGTITKAVLRKHVQLVLTDRTDLSTGRDYAVVSPLTWRLADLGAKLAFLVSGLGWGHMPLHMVSAGLDARTLVKIRVEDVPANSSLPMKAVFRKDTPPGPAGRAFIAQLKG